MNELVRSILQGTAGLSFLLLIALLLTLFRGGLAGDLIACRRVAFWTFMTVGWHAVHLAEEWATGFQRRFPELLGLVPWPDSFFVSFNLAWMAIWLLSAVALQRGFRIALWSLWFLALGSLVNAVAHPVLAVVTGGYFPGLWSSPVCGLLGVGLLRALLAVSRPG